MNAQSKTRELYPLSPRKVVKKTLVATLGWIIFVAIAYSFAGVSLWLNAPEYFGVVSWATVIFLGAILGLTYLYQKWYFNVYYYDLGSDYIVIRKGPITPREITIPYERVQDVYVDQDLFDRIFGIYDVHLSSATISSGMEAHIDGVERAAADGLKDLLLKTVSAKIGRGKK